MLFGMKCQRNDLRHIASYRIAARFIGGGTPAAPAPRYSPRARYGQSPARRLTNLILTAQGKPHNALLRERALPMLAGGGILKIHVIRDQVRNHRVYGWYFLPRGGPVAESVMDAGTLRNRSGLNLHPVL